MNTFNTEAYELIEYMIQTHKDCFDDIIFNRQKIKDKEIVYRAEQFLAMEEKDMVDYFCYELNRLKRTDDFWSELKEVTTSFIKSTVTELTKEYWF